MQSKCKFFNVDFGGSSHLRLVLLRMMLNFEWMTRAVAASLVKGENSCFPLSEVKSKVKIS